MGGWYSHTITQTDPRQMTCDTPKLKSEKDGVDNIIKKAGKIEPRSTLINNQIWRRVIRGRGSEGGKKRADG